jgi:hypothetical protein
VKVDVYDTPLIHAIPLYDGIGDFDLRTQRIPNIRELDRITRGPANAANAEHR